MVLMPSSEQSNDRRNQPFKTGNKVIFFLDMFFDTFKTLHVKYPEVLWYDRLY